MKIEVAISNCNSIDRANIALNVGCLNIKYGPNGVGKSTIARAILSKIRDDGTLAELLPFKLRGNATREPLVPSVEGVDSLKSAIVFDDSYVQQFVFQKDEVVKNSFDIFIRTPEYVEEMTEIEGLLSGVKDAFSKSDEITQVIDDLRELRDAFGKPNKGGGIAKTSKIHKAFGSGNKLENIPVALQPFESFIKSAEPAKWISWQIKGNEFLEGADSCPYCSRALTEPAHKETALAVSQAYDATSVGHLKTLRAVIQRLGAYFSEKCRDNLEKVTKAKVELGAPENAFLENLKSSVDALIERLEALRALSFFSLRDVGELSERLSPLKIDLDMIDMLDSDKTRSVIDPINAQLDSLIKQIGLLKGRLNKHKAKIEKTIEENQLGINSFLRSAGYKYHVEIVAEPDTYKMKLVHQDVGGHIEAAAKHLSYGERNAFALVLFMYQVLSESPDLVVLDDPISSFDKNKKFAILNQLFRGRASLRGKTALLLTHDLEPAIDVIKSTSAIFQGATPTASFLSSKNGVVSEVAIKREDIQSFAKICSANVDSLNDNIIKCIYLRRYYELQDDLGKEYNLLASLFKGRAEPTIRDGSSDRAMTNAEKVAAEDAVRKHFINDFDYDALVAEVNDSAVITKKFHATEVGYEKIQLFRLVGNEHGDDVIRKFINEAYHIENEYVMQLNPHKFDGIPEYVVKECERLL